MASPRPTASVFSAVLALTDTRETLQPSKRIVTMAAAQIYSAYVASGCVPQQGDAQSWIDRSVREAIAIAEQVDHSVQSDEELPDNGKQRLRNVPEESDMPDIKPPD